MEETSYSDWKYVINGYNAKELYACPVCQRPVAALARRYVTDRNGDRFEQFRVQCQICKTLGKVYQNRNVAIQSWIGQEVDKPIFFPRRGKGPDV